MASLVQRIVEAHKSGEANIITMQNKDIAKKFGCGTTTASEARKLIRRIDGYSKMSQADVVRAAHERGDIDLYKDRIVDIANTLAVHHSAVSKVIKELGIERTFSSIRKINNTTDKRHWYWWRFRKEFGVVKTWGVIPERVGKTRNQWKEYCSSLVSS